jgi:hypothetical protein
MSGEAGGASPAPVVDARSRLAGRRRPARGLDLAGRLSGRWTTLLTIYLVSRAFSTTVLFVVYEIASAAGATFITPGSDRSFLHFTASWDADRYRTIALHGYPSVLPTDAAGFVLPNEWAFLPVFPTLSHLLMVGTGMDFTVASVLLATGFGAGAAIVLYRLLETRVGHRGALWAVLLFCFGPMSFVMSVGYAESLSVLLLFGGVLAMQRRDYPVVLLLGVVAAFTRPGALALALALAVHLVVRWRTERADLDRASLVRIVVAGLAIAAAGLAWPVVAHVVTGQADAYLQTEMAWWVDYIGRPGFVPLTPWFLLAGRWLGVGGIVLVLAIIGAGAVFFTRRSTLRLGHEVVGFTVSFALYLVAVFLPQQSLFRLLMPLSPALGTPAISERAWLRRGMLVGGAALQPVAVTFLWLFVAP